MAAYLRYLIDAESGFDQFILFYFFVIDAVIASFRIPDISENR